MADRDRITTEIGRLANPVALLEAMFTAAPMPLQIYDAAGRSVLTNRAFRELYGSEPPPDYNLFLDEIAERRGLTAMIRRAFAGEQVNTPPHWYDPRELEHVHVAQGQPVRQVVTMTPLAGRDGRITHVAIFVKDVTAEHLAQERIEAERARLGILAEASVALTAILDEREAGRRITELLVPRVADLCTLHVADASGHCVRVAEAAFEQDPADAARYLRESAARTPDLVQAAFTSGQVLHIPDYAAWARDHLPVDDFYRQQIERVGVRDAVCVPLHGRDRTIGVLALCTLDATGRTFSQEDIALAGVLGERIGVALDNARLFEAAGRARRAAEVAAAQLADENRVNETLVRLAGAFTGERDEHQLLRLITDEATALIGAAYGAFFFNVDDGAGAAYMLYVLSGDAAEKFATFPMPRATPIFAPTFRGGPPVRLDDVTADPRFGAWGPQPAGHPEVVSYLAVPVIGRDGSVIGGLFFGHPLPARFTAHHERLIVGIASQAAIALESARLYEALRASDERARAAVRRKDEFLAILGHELRNPLAPMVTAIELMRRRPGAEVVERERSVIERQITHLSRLVDDLLDLSRITSGKVTLSRRRLELAAVVAEAVERVSPLLEQRRHHLHVLVPRTGLVVDGDFDRLTQVVTNLLHNAAKYTPEQGHIEVVGGREGDDVIILIRDDGQGIERELLAAIFELFVQGEQDLQRAGGGLGIGLALVRQLVAMHGGTVSAESDGRGKGSTFRVRLPVAPAAVATDQASPSSPLPAAPTGAGKRVLVVDDNVDAAALLGEALTALGHDVRVVGDGLQALAAARELRPQVAIVDIGLPVMDGYELAVLLRGMLTEVPRLVALTGYGQEEDRARARAAGFDEHLVKPASLAAVVRAIDSAT